MPTADACPCTSGLRYRDCCRPFHRSEREAPTPEGLMRSRFSAFARKDAAYLMRTLDESHPDRQRADLDLRAAIQASTAAFRYLGLRILDTREPDARGIAQVLFHARIFERGRDRSFVELSDFRHDGQGWRYIDGKLAAATHASDDATTLTIAAFKAQAR